MLYDLNIPWTSSTTPDQIDRILSFSASLGYNVVALNQTLSGPVPPRPQNPIPVVDPKRASASASSPTISSVLRRATFLYADPSSNYRLSAVAPLYDVFAVRPTTSAAFQHACISLTEAALISLDYSQQLPFRLHSRLVMAAVSRGVRFEVCYGAVLAGGAGTADPRGRANFIANVSNLARASRGRGIVASSGATGPLGLRAPADVINLLAVWGLPPERGGEALGTLPRQVVANEAIKRRGFRAVIEVVETAEREGAPARGRERGEGGGGGRDEAGDGVEAKGGDKGQNQEKNKQGQKRKMREQDNNDGGDGDGVTAPAPAGMSKRQQKRLKKAQKQAEPIIERRPDG